MIHTTPVKLWRGTKKISTVLGKTGVLLYYTMIRLPSKQFADQAPYPVVIVKFNSGEMSIGQLVDWEEGDLVSGRKGVTVLRRISVEDKEDVIPYGIKFKPV